MKFKDRTEAGQVLARKLAAYANHADVVVLALPRGGVPVAFEVATALNVPLDVFLVRKLGVPGQSELAMGAIASAGVRVLNQDIVRSLRLSNAVIDKVAAQEQQELERRERLYRDHRPIPQLHERTVIIVDDGLATGATMRAAIEAIRQQQPARIVVAVPISSPETCRDLAVEVDEIICVGTPQPFCSVGLWYEDFPQTTDEEVRNLLKLAQTTLSTQRPVVSSQ
ncbi:MAG TPA: phosphoribosyl transferase [Cyanobacteria bacterium UBA11049]|nr:phosphoribosyl transferase [Cyanobacteria bacterium UBA11049]